MEVIRINGELATGCTYAADVLANDGRIKDLAKAAWFALSNTVNPLADTVAARFKDGTLSCVYHGFRAIKIGTTVYYV